MSSSPELHSLLTLLVALLCCSSSQGEVRTKLAPEGEPQLGLEGATTGLLMEALKGSMLSSMGMNREPVVIEKASDGELRRMYQLYKKALHEMRENSSHTSGKALRLSKRISTVLLPASVEPLKVSVREAETPDLHHTVLHWYRAIFNSNLNTEEELLLTRAKLKLHTHISDGPNTAWITRDVKVKVYLRTPGNSSALEHIQTLARRNVSSTGDVTLDLRSAVEMWRGSGQGQALVVDVGLVVVGDEPTADHNVTQGLALEVGLAGPRRPMRSRRRRRRRHSNREDSCDEDGHCCRKSVSVSFRDIGWSDWVVAPTSYTMQYCDGSCPHNYKPASMHTQVKSRLYHMMKGATPRPCCVPAAYEPMILMHYDSRGKLKLSPFNDLIVSKCHCA